MPFRTLVLFLGLASSASAQTAAVSGADLSRGVTLLPGSSAFADEGTASIYNPAGLTHVGTLHAVFIHEKSNARAMDNNGLYFATNPIDVAGVGLAFEWLKPRNAQQRAKTILSFAGGLKALSLGVNIHWHFGPPTDGLVAADVGVTSRPLRWLALGFMARNVNSPSNNETHFNRAYTVGLGLRPFGERLTAGVDWIAAEGAALSQSRLQYTLQASIFRGLHILGGFSHGFDGSVPLFFQAGLGINLERLGYTQGVAFVEDKQNWQFLAALSTDKNPSIVPKRLIAWVDLAAQSTSTVRTLLGFPEEDRHLHLLRFLHKAVRDEALAAVVFKVEDTGIGLARAHEIHSGIRKLQEAGKKTFAYVLSASDADYMMIAGCDGIYAAPQAALTIDGLRASVIYLGGTAKQLGIAVEVVRVGKYKNAPDTFTREDMSEAQHEALSMYLDTATKTVEKHVLSARKLTRAQWQAALDEGLKSAKRSQELEQLDGVLTSHEFDRFLKDKLDGARVDFSYKPFDERVRRWGHKPEIAIIPVLGTITAGPPTALSTSASRFIKAITTAANDTNVKAIILRVDSSGGDGLAADMMYRAVLRAKARKPVIASMGDSAASGGYYVAMAADEIFALPTTLTGSIGAFFMKATVKKLAERVGANQTSLSRGKLAGIMDIFEPWSKGQRAAAQKWIDDFYDRFVTEVSDRRKLTKAKVDQIAQGRLWSGADAQRQGLIDRLGGLMDALAAAKMRAGLKPHDDVALTIRVSERGLLGAVLNASTKVLEKPVALLPPFLQELADFWPPRPTVQARMEYLVVIK